MPELNLKYTEVELGISTANAVQEKTEDAKEEVANKVEDAKEEVANKVEDAKEELKELAETAKEKIEELKVLTEKADDVAKIAKVVGMDKKVEEVAEATAVFVSVIEDRLDKIVGITDEVKVEQLPISGCFGFLRRLLRL
jgi:F0F1-type ATP synthase membrane subunit b/b'